MKTNTIKRAFAALAVSAVALSATAINASAETAVGYTSTGKAGADFNGISLELTQKTISLEEAKNAVEITMSVKGNNVQYDSTGIHVMFDDGLELVQSEDMGEQVPAVAKQRYGVQEVREDGNGLFLTFGNSSPKTASANGNAIWTFQVKVKNPEAGKKYPINFTYTEGDQFDLKGSDTTEALRDYAFTHVTQGYVAIEGPTPTTTTTATPTTTTTTTVTTTATDTATTSTTTKRSATTTKPATTTKKVSTTAGKQNSPDTGVPGAGIAVAGLAVAIGTAFVLRKKED